MSIQQMQQDVEIISKLSDTPNETDGLSAQELKEKFDQASVWIKEYINSVLVDAVNSLLGKFDANGKIKADSIPNGVIDTDKIAAAAVTAAKIYNGAVTTDKIAGGAVTSAKITDGAVTAQKLGSKAVGTAALDDGVVTADQIGSGAVETAKIKDGNVTSEKLADGAVTANKIGAKAVWTAALDDGAVTGSQIAAKAVGNSKLDDEAVTTGKIADGAVTIAKTDFVKTSLDATKDTEVPTSKATAGYVSSQLEKFSQESGIVIPLSLTGTTMYSGSKSWDYTLDKPIDIGSGIVELEFDVYGLHYSSSGIEHLEALEIVLIGKKNGSSVSYVGPRLIETRDDTYTLHASHAKSCLAYDASGNYCGSVFGSMVTNTSDHWYFLSSITSGTMPTTIEKIRLQTISGYDSLRCGGVTVKIRKVT